MNEHKLSKIQKVNYKVSGMTCAACAVSLESYLSPVSGIENITVNYANQSISIAYDSELTSLDNLQQKAKEIGYSILIGDEKKTKKAFEEIEEKRLKNLMSLYRD